MSGETATNGVKSESGVTGVTDPRDTDVLCGRGGAALRHPGNQTYRRLVNLNKGLYITCLKTEKLKISRSIVAAIREQRGRFLEKDAAKGNWFDIGDKKAIEKTSQALREGQPKLREKIASMGGGAPGTARFMEQQLQGNGIYAQNAAAGMHMQQQGMRGGGFDPTNLAQQMGGGGQLGGGQMGGGQMMPMMNVNQQHHSMASAMRQQQQMNQYGQQQQHPGQNYHQQQQQRMQPQQDMPPPQARQALHSEMMRLSMHGNDDDPNQQRHSGQNHRGSGMGGNSAQDPMPLRPSLVKRGSAAAAELGMQGQGTSNMSLMSNFSNFSDSNHGAQFAGGTTRTSSHNDPYNVNPYNQQDMDRRRLFAGMKYSRQPSDRMSGRQIGGASAHSIGDGMPDFHMVESQLSLYSNLSGMTGNDSKTKASFGDETAGSSSKKPAAGGDLLGAGGSRHSIMSGLSRISDTSEVHSIFSDLSRKIGNVSTRSLAMSEVSGIDAYRGGNDSDSTPSFGEADPKTAPMGTMDFDVF